MSDLTLRDRLLAAHALMQRAEVLGSQDGFDTIAAAIELSGLATRIVVAYAPELKTAFEVVHASGAIDILPDEPSPAAFGGDAGWLLIETWNGERHLYTIDRDNNDPVDEIADDWAAFVYVLNRATAGDKACIEALAFHVRDLVDEAARIA